MLALFGIFSLCHNLTLENFQLDRLVVFFNELSILSQNGYFLKIVESSLKVERVKEKFSDILGQNILALFNNLAQALLQS